jgi:hypothetical protein
MRSLPLVVGLTLALLAAAAAPRDGTGAVVAGVIDRTLLCTTQASGGVREINVRANPGYRQGAAWGILAFAVVATGAETHSTAILTDSLAWVSAGKYNKDTNLEPSDGVAVANAARLGTSALNRTVCTPAEARVPLSGTGRRSAAPGPLGVSFHCAAPQRVRLRVRAVSGIAPARYRVPLFEKTRTPLQSGYLAVRTQAGRQLAFASVSEAGKARLLTASGCTED